jgi:membrane-bound metal-dependent hydrolase YbcI (DUF457 family)
MHRKGHWDVLLLAYAPVLWVLLEANRLPIAIAGAVIVYVTEPLPDLDFRLPFLTHRGTSHSLLGVVVIGALVGTICYAIAMYGSPLLELAGLSLRPIQASIYGFIFASFGVVAHLLGDVITRRGICPFLPVSRYRVSVLPIRAESRSVNLLLLLAGIIAIVGIVLTSTPVGALAGAPSVQLVERVGAQATTDTANNTSTIEMANQSLSAANGSAVTVESVTLSEPGYVAIHGEGYATGPAPAESSVIAVSGRLPAGTHRNLTIDVSDAPAGNPPALNRSRINDSQTLAAVAYGDSNDNDQFDFIQSFGKNDTAILSNGSVVRDTARVTVPTPPERTASVTLRNQTLQNQNRALVVDRARLPDGGFVVVHNASYRVSGDALSSAVGLSEYLPPGNHTDVRVRLLPGALSESQVVTVRPARDTNGNQRYDYISSGGFRDVAYETLNHSATIGDTALVRVPNSRQTTPPTASSTPTTSTATGTATPPQTTASSSVESDDSLGLSPLQLIAGGFAVLVVATLSIVGYRKFR